MLIKTAVLLLVFFTRSSYALEESLNDFTLAGYDKQNNKKWEVEGESAQLSKDDVALESIKARLYSDNGPVDMRADKGFLNKVNRQVVLTGSVVVKNLEGDTLFTDILRWDQDRDVIWTEDRLRIVKNDSEISGEGGEVDTKLTKAVIKKDVKFKTVPQIIIKSDGPLDIDYTENIAVFSDNVHVLDRRGELFCDKLIIYFNKDEKGISRAHAKGNVKLRRGNSLTYSSEAIYDLKEGKVNLLGRPKLEIYPE
ncbi:MAG: LPS export ABC transporter periplasmic protein LptC [Candidatus Kaelpia aquatica]|nr:LPS export ABC transporter periplasmic protein LptC [Candidatus Kaelpia aquatica]